MPVPHAGRALQRPKPSTCPPEVYGAMTSFTTVARTSFTPRLEFLAEEARNDALENNRRGRAADAVRDSSDKRNRAAVGFVPGVWDFPADRLWVATAVPTVADANADQRAQSATSPQSDPHWTPPGAACGGLAKADGVGCEKAARAAAGRRDSAAGANDSPDFGAEWFGQ